MNRRIWPTALSLLLLLTACTGESKDPADTTPAMESQTEALTPAPTELITEHSTEFPTETEPETESAPVELTFSWKNPTILTSKANKIENLRDPFILKVGDVWYMTGTLPPYFPAPEPDRTKGVPLYKSEDLTKWTFVDYIVKTPPESEGKWYSERFWAAELFHHNGKFYVTVNCCKPDGSNHGMLFAVSDHIEGPYTLMNPDAPLVLSNDAHLFVDDDGRTYLFGSGNWYAEIDLADLTLLSEPNYIVVPVKGSDAWNGERPRVGFEGPYVIKRDGTYYMFYSTWARGYEIGIATATSLDGEWTLWEKPFYGAMSQSLCNLYGATYEPGYYVAQDQYTECGHNSLFIGPDGEYWLAAHAYAKRNIPQLVIDRITFTEDGNVLLKDYTTNEVVNGPTWGEKTITYTPVDRAKLTVVGVLPVHRYTDNPADYELPGQVDIRLRTPSGVEWRECVEVTWNDTVSDSEGPDGKTRTITGTVTFAGQMYEAVYIVHVL